MVKARLAWVKVFALLLVISMVGVSLADDTKGVFKSVLADGKTFVITDVAGKDQTFQLAPMARILIDDREGKLTDLRAGDVLTVTWEMQPNQKAATLVLCKKQ